MMGQGAYKYVKDIWRDDFCKTKEKHVKKMVGSLIESKGLQNIPDEVSALSLSLFLSFSLKHTHP